MPSPSKVKGSTFEREIARYLTDTYGQTFVRVPTSGAFVGGSNAHRATTLDQHQLAARKGDIQPPTGWHINIECKSYAAIPWHQIVQQSCKQLDTWIEQLEQVSEPNDIDIIFFKITRQGSYVAVKCFEGLVTSGALSYKDYLIYDLDLFFQYNTEALKIMCTRV